MKVFIDFEDTNQLVEFIERNQSMMDRIEFEIDFIQTYKYFGKNLDLFTKVLDFPHHGFDKTWLFFEAVANAISSHPKDNIKAFIDVLITFVLEEIRGYKSDSEEDMSDLEDPWNTLNPDLLNYGFQWKDHNTMIPELISTAFNMGLLQGIWGFSNFAQIGKEEKQYVYSIFDLVHIDLVKLMKDNIDGYYQNEEALKVDKKLLKNYTRHQVVNIVIGLRGMNLPVYVVEEIVDRTIDTSLLPHNKKIIIIKNILENKPNIMRTDDDYLGDVYEDF